MMIKIKNENIGKVRLLAVEDHEENEISVVFMEDSGLDENEEYLNAYNENGVLGKLIINFDSDCIFIDMSVMEENQILEISKIFSSLFIKKLTQDEIPNLNKAIVDSYYNSYGEFFMTASFKSNSKEILKNTLKQCNIPKVSQKELEEVVCALDDIESYNLGLKPEYEMYKSN